MNIKSITYDDAVALIQKLDLPIHCPQCGHITVNIPSRKFGDVEYVELSTLQTVAENGSESTHGRYRCEYKTLPIICSRCGYVRHFMLEHLLNNTSS
ncbi:hypothetical protein VAEKB19_810002 [Vibrio aestuarianus]|nr:hypothetical protein VAEKB19_810002 [Vibrio aestuarianus]